MSRDSPTERRRLSGQPPRECGVERVPYGVTVPSWWDRAGAGIALILGLLWAVRSLQSVIAEPDLSDPSGVADWWAVVSVSVALALVALGRASLPRLAPGAPRGAGVRVATAGLGGATAAVANLVESGGVDAAGTVYLVSMLVTVISMVVLGIVWLGTRPRWPGLVVLSTVIGMMLLERGGGVLVLVSWVSVAIAAGRRPTP